MWVIFVFSADRRRAYQGQDRRRVLAHLLRVLAGARDP